QGNLPSRIFRVRHCGRCWGGGHSFPGRASVSAVAREHFNRPKHANYRSRTDRQIPGHSESRYKCAAAHRFGWRAYFQVSILIVEPAHLRRWMVARGYRARAARLKVDGWSEHAIDGR